MSLAEARTAHDDACQGFTEYQTALSAIEQKLTAGELTPEAAAAETKEADVALEAWKAKFELARKRLDAAQSSDEHAAVLEKLAARESREDHRPQHLHPVSGAGVNTQLMSQGRTTAGHQDRFQDTSLESLSAQEREHLARISGYPSSQAVPVFTHERRDLLNRHLAHLADAGPPLTAEEMETFQSREELAANTTPYIQWSGGLLRSGELLTEVLMHLRDEVTIRSRSRVITTTAHSVTVPTAKESIPMTPKNVGQERQDPTDIEIGDFLGMQHFSPREWEQWVGVPEELVNNQSPGYVYDVVGHIAEELAGDRLEQEERQFLTSRSRPLGMLAKGTNGQFIAEHIPHTGQASTALFTAEDIRTFEYNHKAKYKRNLTWIGPRAFLRRVTTLRTESNGPNTGTFLFTVEGLRVGDTPVLIGKPVILSEFFPNNHASGDTDENSALALLGDLRQYWVVVRPQMEMKQFDQTEAKRGLIQYRFKTWLDAAPVRPEAFKVLQRT